MGGVPGGEQIGPRRTHREPEPLQGCPLDQGHAEQGDQASPKLRSCGSVRSRWNSGCINQPRRRRSRSPPGAFWEQRQQAAAGTEKQHQQTPPQRPSENSCEAAAGATQPMAVRLRYCSTGKPCSRHAHIHHARRQQSCLASSDSHPGGKGASSQPLSGIAHQGRSPPLVETRYLSFSRRHPLRQGETWAGGGFMPISATGRRGSNCQTATIVVAAATARSGPGAVGSAAAPRNKEQQRPASPSNKRGRWISLRGAISRPIWPNRDLRLKAHPADLSDSGW